jgi:hypothetical protein
VGNVPTNQPIGGVVDSPQTDGWEGTYELDERFMPDYVGYGMSELTRYLLNQTRFDNYYAAHHGAESEA